MQHMNTIPLHLCTMNGTNAAVVQSSEAGTILVLLISGSHTHTVLVAYLFRSGEV